MRSLDPLTLPLSGSRLIEASAGTGKTYTIASLYLRLVLAGQAVGQILVVTFTEAATAELKDRLRRRLREALDAFVAYDGGDDPFLQALLTRIPLGEHPRARRLLQAALSGFDEAAIMTIHGFCLRALQENAFESGAAFDARLVTDPHPVYQDIAADFWALEVYDLPMAWVRFLARRQVTVDRLADVFSRVAGHPDRLVLPPTEMVGHVALFETLYREARHIWRLKRDELTQLLATHKGVNRRSYNRPNLERWLGDVDEYFAGEDPATLPNDTHLEKFSQQRLCAMAGKMKDAPAPPRHLFFSLCERMLFLAEQWCVQFQRRFLDFARKALAQRKEQMGIRFFDDLIQDLDAALSDFAGPVLARHIRERYRVALIDEFQDTDKAQYRIFKTIYAQQNLPLFMIGDPKQSIYAFRGADVFAYLQAAGDAREAVFTLDVNWRSDPALVGAVNVLFDVRRVPLPFGMEGIGYHPVRPRPGACDALRIDGRFAPPLTFLYLGPETFGDATSQRISKQQMDAVLPGMVAADICRMLERGALDTGGGAAPLQPGDIAVLVRTNRQGRMMQAAFRAAGLPSVLTSRDSVFSTPEAEAFWQVLRAVAVPTDETRLFTALATQLVGLTAETIDRLRAGDARLEWWVLRFRQWQRTWQETGFIRMAHQLFAETAPDHSDGILMRLLSFPGGERQVTNYQHLAELLHAAAVSEHLGQEGLMRWFERQRSGREETSADQELRLEGDRLAVRIVTVHKSKGLEYPVVYLPYLWDGALRGQKEAPAECHQPAHGNRPVLDLGSACLEEHLAQAGREEMSENLRLLYVALTRARHACRVVWGPVKAFETSALGYLLHRSREHGDPEAAAAYLSTLPPAQVAKDLDALAAKHPACMGIAAMVPGTAAHYAPPPQAAPRLTCRTLEVLPVRRWRVESFSRLAAESGAPVSPDEEMGIDRDRRAQDADTPPLDNGGVPPESATVPLATFGRGRDAGTFFHSLYERMDFADATAETIRPLVSEALDGHGLDRQAWAGPVAAAVADTLQCPLDPQVPGLRLGALSRQQRLNELGFVFPAAASVSPKAVAAVFRRHRSDRVPPDYPGRIGALGFGAFQGVLKGFMDMVFSYQGRWYLADYKSNFLGEQFGAYAPLRLTEAMAAHHYFLQYHLYLVALHRYLAYRIPGYDYAAHFGGVYYLFIRGMSPATGHAVGVFRDRPKASMVQALSDIFG